MCSSEISLLAFKTIKSTIAQTFMSCIKNTLSDSIIYKITEATGFS